MTGWSLDTDCGTAGCLLAISRNCNMKFYTVSGENWPDGILDGEYKNARSIGALRIGSAHVFFKAKLKTYAVAGRDLERVYRRVMLVPARMCCGRGDLAVEYIVLEAGGRPVAQIQMPGERAGRAALEGIKEVAPEAEYRCPPAQEVPEV